MIDKIEPDESRKIPRKILWAMRYSAYRHKYGRWKSFTKGIVRGEIQFHLPERLLARLRWGWKDEMELLEHLDKAELVGVEFHLTSPQMTREDWYIANRGKYGHPQIDQDLYQQAYEKYLRGDG